MATTYPALFDWYSIVITWSILFIVAVSIYLYLQSRKSRKGQRRSFIRDFAVVWVLVGLLCLYIVAIDMSAYALFALGNVIVEVYVVYYILRNKVAP
jgi:amino acid transporter